MSDFDKLAEEAAIYQSRLKKIVSDDLVLYNENSLNVMRKTFGKHPTQKPLALLERCILSASNIGDLIFDPFMGSGTTGVAALKHDRKFCGCELEEDFFELAKKRLEK